MDWDALLSNERLRGRTHAVDAFDKRSAFDSDFDRVVFSSSFRRLQDKTQVFPLESHDFVRTRLTHSIEVSAIGRALGLSAGKVLQEQRKLAANYSHEWSTIVATASLLHDIGNPPFGHSGERYIGDWVKQKLASKENGTARCRGGAPLILADQERADLENFEGNAHAFRVATRLQTLGSSYGLNLTCGTLAALVKYPCSSVERGSTKATTKFGYFRSDKVAFECVREKVKLEPGIRHPLVYLVEAADDIGYSVADIEDALKKRVLGYEQIVASLESLPEELKTAFLANGLNATHERLSGFSPGERQQLAFQNFRALAVGKMIASCVKAFSEHFDAIKSGTFTGELVDGMELAPLCRALKNLAATHVYSCADVVRVEESGKHVLWALLDIFYDELHHSPGSRLIKTFLPQTPVHEVDGKPEDMSGLTQDYRNLQRVVDYVAGMTDTFAVSLFRRLTGGVS